MCHRTGIQNSVINRAVLSDMHSMSVVHAIMTTTNTSNVANSVSPLSDPHNVSHILFATVLVTYCFSGCLSPTDCHTLVVTCFLSFVTCLSPIGWHLVLFHLLFIFCWLLPSNCFYTLFVICCHLLIVCHALLSCLDYLILNITTYCLSSVSYNLFIICHILFVTCS